MRTRIATVVRLFQMLSFVLSTAPGAVWIPETIAPVKYVAAWSALVGPSTWHFWTAPAYLGIYYFSLAWVVVYVSLFLWSALSLMTGNVKALWPLQLLRAIGECAMLMIDSQAWPHA